MKPFLIVVILVVVGAAGWFFVSPLFIDEVVDEAFDLSSLPTRADVQDMSEGERKDAMDKVMDMMANAPDVEAKETQEMPAQPQLLGRGTFSDADAVHKGKGDALLYQLDDGSQLLRFENFRVTNGPALVVYLAEHSDPKEPGDVTPGFYNLGKLKGNVGNQNYVIPADVDITKYNSVVIWCELFDVLFSPASLGIG
ncbi:MAG: DM13 domain-containing protein [Pseudomonadota bacterium]